MTPNGRGISSRTKENPGERSKIFFWECERVQPHHWNGGFRAREGAPLRRKREVATVKKRQEFFDIRKEKRGSTEVIFWKGGTLYRERKKVAATWWREHIHRPAIYRGV